MNSKAIKRQLLAAIAMVLVAAIALGSSTYAWFVSNTKVTATSSSVKATSATPNLLIVEGGEVGTPVVTGGKTAASITSTEATALYPASTDDCKNWWVVSEWNSGTGTAPLASKYRNPKPTLSGNDANVKYGSYNQGSTSLNAYQVSTYSVYTTYGDVELNLDPTDPILVDVSTPGQNTNKNGFKDALRVGIVVDGTLKLVYAPTDNESGGAKGNDSDAVTGWRTVENDSNTKDVTYPVVAGDTFTDWTATDNGDGTYGNATNSLGKVTTTGSVVQIYVWLEGTDSDCLVGTADEATDDNAYKVTLNFVGSPSTTSVGP